MPGTDAAAGFELESETAMPPAGAGAFMLTTFPVVVLPPFVVVGDSTTEDTATGVSVRTAVLVTPA